MTTLPNEVGRLESTFHRLCPYQIAAEPQSGPGIDFRGSRRHALEPFVLKQGVAP